MCKLVCNVVTAISDYLADKEEEMLVLLSSLVNIDSGSYDAGGVARIIQTILVNLKELGFATSCIDSSLVARKRGTGGKKILLIGHADTVYDRGTALERPCRIEKDKIYGPGVADMKSGLVILLYALKSMEKLSFNKYQELVVIIGADEEIGSPTSRAIYEKESEDADVCLVFEPARADGSLVSSRKGVGLFNLSIKGIAAHAGEAPEKGVSAIKELAYKIIELEKLNDYQKGVSVNVGVTQGGSRSNVIAEQAKAEIDLRIPDMQIGETVLKKIEEIASNPVDARVMIGLSGGLNRPPMVRTKTTDTLLNIVKDAAHLLDMEIRHHGAGGGSDGNFVAAKGVPVVDGMGAIGDNYHNEGEYIYKNSLLTKAKLAALALYQICNR